MSWTGVVALCVAAYALKLLGVWLGGRVSPESATRWSLDALAVPVLAALIVVQTFDGGRRLVLDARAPALLIAAILVWRRAPFLVVALTAAGTAAGLRLITP